MGRGNIFNRPDIAQAYKAVSGLCAPFEYGVLALGAGVVLYFAWPAEPSLTVCLAILAALGLFWGWVRGRAELASRHIQAFLALLILVTLGLSRAAWHTAELDYPILPAYERSYDVQGHILAVEKSGPRLRWVVRPVQMSTLPPQKIPYKIRVSTHSRAFMPGDKVRFTARLSAPPGPAVPGGYDPAKRAYFQAVGGYGYMISKPASTDIASPETAEHRLELAIAAWRYKIAGRIMEKAPQETAGLQTALLTGIRAYVPEAQTQALRAAGLAHVLAISGLHMGFTAGAAYFLSAIMFSALLPLSRRYDMRKAAACVGIVIATAYLILSGASVATQRAYIMALIVFFALILNRRALSLRSVSLAAVITLLLHPEALISAGFQMSFAAVTALIIVYQFWDSLRVFSRRKNFFERLKNHITSLSITSLIAGLATSGFALLHFNRMASYNLIGNLFAMPIFTFWVMPSALLVFVTMPFGLEELPLWLMGRGLTIILNMSYWIESWPGSVSHMASAPGYIVALFGMAFITLCLAGSLRIRAGAAATLLLCLCFHLFIPRPDMRISEDGNLAIWQSDSRGKLAHLLVDNKRKDRFGRERFAQAAGEVNIPLIEFSDAKNMHCDPLGCRFLLRGQRITLVYDPTEIAEDCAHSDLIIVPRRVLGVRAKRLCTVRVIDAADLKEQGAHSLSLTKDGEIKLRRAHTASQNRPWRART